MAIEWTEDLATGIEEIDDQHRALYDAISDLHDAMRRSRLDRVPAVLEFLSGYVAEHFATEEREMAATGYPGLDEHRAAHLAFGVDYRQLVARVEGSRITPLLVLELSTWLGEWLRDHVRRIDGAMARHIRASRGPGPRRGRADGASRHAGPTADALPPGWRATR